MVPDGVHAAAVAALMSHRLHSSWQRCQALRLPSCLQGVTRLCCATRTRLVGLARGHGAPSWLCRGNSNADHEGCAPGLARVGFASLVEGPRSHLHPCASARCPFYADDACLTSSDCACNTMAAAVCMLHSSKSEVRDEWPVEL